MLGVDTRGIDEILLEMGVLKIVDLKKAWDIQRESNKNIEDVLLELGIVSQKDIMHANAVKMGIPFVDLSTYQISDSSVPLLITRNIANRYKVIPIEKELSQKQHSHCRCRSAVFCASSLQDLPLQRLALIGFLAQQKASPLLHTALWSCF